MAGLKARNAQLERENDELKKRLTTPSTPSDQLQHVGSLAGFDRRPLPRPTPRPTAARPPTPVRRPPVTRPPAGILQKLGAIGTTSLPPRNTSSAKPVQRASGSLLRSLHGRPPAPGSLTAEDIWAPRGSPERYTELKSSTKKRSFPYPLSTPDDWLREVLEFFPVGAAHEGEGAAAAPHNKFLINFGGHYLPSDIVALAQAMDGAVGCAIDSDDPMTYAAAGVTKHVGFVTLGNVGSLLKGCKTPSRPLLLKMDIDSVDVDVTLAVLSAGYSPAFIFVELNEKVPPPICYCNRQPLGVPPRTWERLGGHHYGCSLTGFVNALAPQGYRLVSVILNDALFVHERHAPQVARRLPGGTLPTPEAAFGAGYRDVPGRQAHYSWNRDVDHWLNETRYSLAERGRMVHSFFAAGIQAKKYADFAVGSAAWPCREG